jgi:hypothetical protein
MRFIQPREEAKRTGFTQMLRYAAYEVSKGRLIGLAVAQAAGCGQARHTTAGWQTGSVGGRTAPIASDIGVV